VISFATELDRHTAYPVLARPLPRAAFVLGKYVGVVAAMELVVLVMVLATALTVWLAGGDVATAFWGSVWLCLVEMTLVVALALLFSSITVPPLAAAYTGGVIIAGNLAADMLAFAEKLESKGEALGTVLRGFYYLVPDLEKLSLRTQAANSLPLPWDYLLLGTLYGLTYAAATLVLTTWIFSRRKAV
jgi:ABC-type transport system involved in multi-copper enzyme maturation permease subunit